MSAWRLKAGTSHNRGGHDRDQVAQFLNPQQGYRGALLAAGVKPKDHMKENYLALKFQQAKKREEEMKKRDKKVQLTFLLLQLHIQTDTCTHRF